MAKYTQTKFTAGEVSPAVSNRVDLDWYGSALSKCSNAYVKAQGGVYNREGSRFIGEVGESSSGEATLIPFSYNKTQSYILVFGKNNLEIIYKDSYLTNINNNSRIRIATTYTLPHLIRYAGFADTMTLVDGHNIPHELKRLGHQEWTITPIDFAISLAAPSGVVITSTAKEPKEDKVYSYAVTSVSKDGKESLPLKKDSPSIAFLGQSSGAKLVISSSDTAESFNIYKSISAGTGLYGFIGRCERLGGGVGTFVDQNYAPDLAISPPLNNDPFIAPGNRPRTTGFYQQRRIFASTSRDPQKIFCTETGDINSMRHSLPLRATDSITQDIVSDSINEIRHIIAFEGLIVLTSEGELKVTEGENYVISPSTFGARVVSNYGSSGVTPVSIGDTVIFSQEQGARLIGINSSLSALGTVNGVIGTDLTLRAEHLFEGSTITDISYCKEPNSILWIVLSNGNLVGLTYNKEQKLWAFHQHNTQGRYRSIATIPNGNVSSAYYMVDRRIDGVLKKYVEKFEERRDTNSNVATSFFVDCGTLFTGIPQSSFRGLWYLNNMDVSVLADGRQISGLKVSPHGVLTLPNGLTASKLQVGLGYKTEINTLPIDSPQNSMIGNPKTVGKVTVNMLNTDKLTIAPINDIEIVPVGDSAHYDSNVGTDGILRSGVSDYHIDAAVTEFGRISVTHDTPLPMCILSLTLDY